VRGKKAHIVSAIQALITEGNVRTETGSNRALHHYVETPFDQDDQ